MFSCVIMEWECSFISNGKLYWAYNSTFHVFEMFSFFVVFQCAHTVGFDALNQWCGRSRAHFLILNILTCMKRMICGWLLGLSMITTRSNLSQPSIQSNLVNKGRMTRLGNLIVMNM